MKKLVVIVEDSESVASSLAVAVEGIPDVKAIVANHPRAALRLFHTPEIHVAAMVTDLNLPTLDGFELIREIRQLEAYRNLPAIMITAEEQITCANGDTVYSPNVIFRKPFSMREVCRVLEGML
jgi:two-component system, chemotaxis family, chemotaxis protein CheY